MTRTRKIRGLLLAITALSAIFAASCAFAGNSEPITIAEQGSFLVGGKVLETPGEFDPTNPTDPKGQTLHGDHAYVFYQIPVSARKLPLVFLHGAGQFSKTWETTPDGREGFQNIFLRRGFPVYLIDQPRRGNAGRSTESGVIEAVTNDQMFWGNFRIGVWPDIFDGAQFPRDSESRNQFLRQITPNTGPLDFDVVSDAVAKLHDKLGKGILITHSQGGLVGWYAAMKSPHINAIVSYEPSFVVFPEGETPAPVDSSYGKIEMPSVPMEDFMKLTKMPILVYYGDFIPEKPTKIAGLDQWRVRMDFARRWVETINRHGGDARLVHLPEVGIHGNTHFPFSDLNNIQIADLLSEFLQERGLDARS